MFGGLLLFGRRKWGVIFVMWNVYFIYFVHDTLFSFPFYEKIRTPVRRSENLLIHHFSRFFFVIFAIMFCRIRWVWESFYPSWNLEGQTVGASFLSDSIILKFLVQKVGRDTAAREPMCSTKATRHSRQHKKIEIVIWKKISLKLSPSILSLLLLMPFSFMFNLWRT